MSSQKTVNRSKIWLNMTIGLKIWNDNWRHHAAVFPILQRGSIGHCKLTSDRNRRNHPWKWHDYLNEGQEHPVRCISRLGIWKHDCNSLSLKKNQKGWPPSQYWKRTAEDSSPKKDCTKSLVGAIFENWGLRIRGEDSEKHNPLAHHHNPTWIMVEAHMEVGLFYFHKPIPSKQGYYMSPFCHENTSCQWLLLTLIRLLLRGLIQWILYLCPWNV